MQIEEVTLSTPDLEALETFYGELLGLPTSYLRGEHLSVQIGESTLIFEPGAPARYHFAIRIPAASFAAAYAWIKQRVPLIADSTGADVIEHTGWNARAVYFYDPAGNIVELIAHMTLSDTYADPFNANALLAICEIGIATDDVRAAAADFAAALGAEPFRGSSGPDFAAIGDAHGLLIVVSRARTWYPDTGVAAELLPLHVVAIANDGRRITIAGPSYTIRKS
jgi:catechol-2,3-dioxygenase